MCPMKNTITKKTRLWTLGGFLVLCVATQLFLMTYTWIRGQGESPLTNRTIRALAGEVESTPTPIPAIRVSSGAPERMQSGRSGGYGVSDGMEWGPSGMAAMTMMTAMEGMEGTGPMADDPGPFQAELLILKADWSEGGYGEGPMMPGGVVPGAGPVLITRSRAVAELEKFMETPNLSRPRLRTIIRRPTPYLFPDELAVFYRTDDWDSMLRWLQANNLVMDVHQPKNQTKSPPKNQPLPSDQGGPEE